VRQTGVEGRANSGIFVPLLLPLRDLCRKNRVGIL